MVPGTPQTQPHHVTQMVCKTRQIHCYIILLQFISAYHVQLYINLVLSEGESCMCVITMTRQVMVKMCNLDSCNRQTNKQYGIRIYMDSSLLTTQSTLQQMHSPIQTHIMAEATRSPLLCL